MAGKQDKKGRKLGRTRDKCKRYRDRMTRETNKAERFFRHIRKFPQDVGTVNAFKAFQKKNPGVGNKIANRLASRGVSVG